MYRAFSKTYVFYNGLWGAPNKYGGFGENPIMSKLFYSLCESELDTLLELNMVLLWGAISELDLIPKSKIPRLKIPKLKTHRRPAGAPLTRPSAAHGTK